MKGSVSIVYTRMKKHERCARGGGTPSMEYVLTVREKSNSLLDVACKP